MLFEYKYANFKDYLTFRTFTLATLNIEYAQVMEISMPLKDNKKTNESNLVTPCIICNYLSFNKVLQCLECQWFHYIFTYLL